MGIFSPFEAIHTGERVLNSNGHRSAKEQSLGVADEERLLAGLRQKKDSAFLDLYDRYQGMVFRFLLHMTGNDTAAEELTQELFVSILKSFEKEHVLERFNTEKGCLEAYLIGFARNLARRSHSKAQRWTSLGALEVAYEPTVLEEISSRSEVQRLRQAILDLPPAYREVVILCGLEEKRYQDVARMLDCPVGTVASRFNRGRMFLAKRLSNRLEHCVRSESCAQNHE
jgi:RNA polymerase sigma-70 factor, ECF subfamily